MLTYSQKWDRRFLRLAEHISTWSKDPSSKVGAVVITDNRLVVGMGYNGFPRGMEDDEARYLDREFKYRHVVHAEVNAIVSAGHQARGATLYIWPTFGFPNICAECCKVAVQAGISRVVGSIHIVDPTRAARWAETIEASKLMLREAGITWHGIEMTPE